MFHLYAPLFKSYGPKIRPHPTQPSIPTPQQAVLGLKLSLNSSPKGTGEASPKCHQGQHLLKTCCCPQQGKIKQSVQQEKNRHYFHLL